ncbi:unnamed protein product, partial [Discosporangium mesarthrocarpum]
MLAASNLKRECDLSVTHLPCKSIVSRWQGNPPMPPRLPSRFPLAGQVDRYEHLRMNEDYLRDLHIIREIRLAVRAAQRQAYQADAAALDQEQQREAALKSDGGGDYSPKSMDQPRGMAERHIHLNPPSDLLLPAPKSWDLIEPPPNWNKARGSPRPSALLVSKHGEDTPPTSAASTCPEELGSPPTQIDRLSQRQCRPQTPFGPEKRSQERPPKLSGVGVEDRFRTNKSSPLGKLDIAYTACPLLPVAPGGPNDGARKGGDQKTKGLAAETCKIPVLEAAACRVDDEVVEVVADVDISERDASGPPLLPLSPRSCFDGLMACVQLPLSPKPQSVTSCQSMENSEKDARPKG